MSDIDPIKPPDPPSIPAAKPILPATEPTPAEVPAEPKIAEPPALDVERRVKNQPIVPKSGRRSSKPFVHGSITYIASIILDSSANRIALLSPQGPPVRGDVGTDLQPGVYHLKVDTKRKQWVFERNEVKTGCRFYVDLDSPDPFDAFQYPEIIPLLVQQGFTPKGPDSFQNLKATISKFVNDDILEETFVILVSLNEVDLYDVLDELWLDEPVVIQNLLRHFDRASELGVDDQLRILQAMESFQEKPKDIYIDNFDKCFVHPSSFARDKSREQKGLTNIKLVFTYDRGPKTTVA